MRIENSVKRAEHERLKRENKRRVQAKEEFLVKEDKPFSSWARAKLSYKRWQSWVYFVQAGNNGPIKVGVSENVIGRMAELQVGNSAELNLLGAFLGDVTDERRLHHKYRRYRIRGEWFKPSKSVLKLARCHPVGPPADLVKKGKFIIDRNSAAIIAYGEDMDEKYIDRYNGCPVMLIPMTYLPIETVQ